MKKVFNLLIIDESGSMSIIEKQALAGLNETIETIQKMQELHQNMEQRITLITFNGMHTRLLYNNITPTEAHTLTPHNYRPCGATPLYDAIGLGISKINAQSSDDDNVLVTIITDGMENCSEEYNLKMVKNLIEKFKKQGWTFTFIGTDNLDVEGISNAMGIDNHLEFTEDAEGTGAMFERDRASRIRYNKCASIGEPMSTADYFNE